MSSSYPRWDKVSLGDCVTLMKSGLSRKLSSEDIGMPMLRSNNIGNKYCSFNEIKFWYVDDPQGARTSDYILNEGDLLVNFINSIAQIGKACLYKDEIGRDCLYTTNILRLKPNSKIESEFLYYITQTSGYSLFVHNITKPAVNQASFTTEDFKKYIFFLPKKYEQIAIADLLSIWDHAGEKTAQMIIAKEKQYLWLLGNLISNDKNPHGHVRDFALEVSTRNKTTAIDLVLSVTNNRGFVLPSDQFERRVAGSDLSNYKIVTHGQYAYNPSRINVGSIARLDGWNKGVLSPMYVVFELNEKKVNSDYFLHWLESHAAKERIRNSAQGSVRETVSFTDLGTISFPLPSLDKQIAVASILNTTRKEINLLKKQLEAYGKQKRGLMQKLLTGHWRVKATKELGNG